MKKIFLLIITGLLLTGCTVNYELEIKDNNFNEKITGNVLNSEINDNEGRTDINPYDFLINYEQPVFYNNTNILYNKTLNRKQDSIDFDYSYNYNEHNFINSRLLTACFDNYTFETKDNKYYIYVSGNFKCNYADTTKINITTNYNVTAHNADKIKKNTYTWTIDKDNSEDVRLFITIDKSNTTSSSNWGVFKIISLIILIVLSAVCIFIIKKKQS